MQRPMLYSPRRDIVSNAEPLPSVIPGCRACSRIREWHLFELCGAWPELYVGGALLPGFCVQPGFHCDLEQSETLKCT